MTGSFTSAVKTFAISYGASYAFAEIGASGLKGYEKVFAHGMIGGVQSVLQGGKFGHGFVSAAMGKVVTNKFGSYFAQNPGTGLVVTAVVGGTSSKISGGKFANGAVTASMGYILNFMQNERPMYEEMEDAEIGVGGEISLEVFGQKAGGIGFDTDNPGEVMLNGPTLKAGVGPHTKGGGRNGVNIQFDEEGLTAVGVDAKIYSAGLSVDGEQVRVNGGACATVFIAGVCGNAAIKGNPSAIMRNSERALINTSRAMQVYKTPTGNWYSDIMAVFGIRKYP